jgi:hypothetical protein
MRFYGIVALSLVIVTLLLAGCSQPASDVKPTITTMITTVVGIVPITSSVSGASQTTVSASPSATASVSSSFTGRYIDVHSHINTDGVTYTALLSSMDKEGVDTMVIMETPGALWIQGGSPTKYGVPDAMLTYPTRFITLCSGDAGKMLYTATRSGSYTPEDEARYKSLLTSAAQSGTCRGFGEIGVRHFPPMGMAQTYDITVPADHPWMFDMSDIAAQYGIPVDIHMEATSVTVPQLERLLAHNRNTTIIWDHAGWGNTGEATPALMRRLLAENPNLYTSIKYRDDMAGTGFLNKDGSINAAWLTVVQEFPDRFMMGSDIKPGIWDNEFRQVKKHVSIISQMPPDIQNKVARENAIRIFRIT